MMKMGLILLAFMLWSCGQKSTGEPAGVTAVRQTAVVTAAPDFNADSAYRYVANQVAFGPRVPNSAAHRACADYLTAELKRFGAEVFVQEAVLEAYDGTRLDAKNIIGSYNPEQKRRVLLFAHWDSRPFADDDADRNNRHTPILGADDGASGVGVLLEIARQLGLSAPEVGIDIVFFDAEDYGVHADAEVYKADSWCLGSQFWAKNPHVPNYRAEYGILLDMVGHKDAVFYKEMTSLQYAAAYVEKIWSTARKLGYGRYFINAKGGYITDDHEYVMKGRGIPSVDIIYYDPSTEKKFGAHWHTLNDTMENISTETLKAVGQTVLEVVYSE
jgi:Zn-dependent M28 family amino/carboxypeptidase